MLYTIAAQLTEERGRTAAHYEVKTEREDIQSSRLVLSLAIGREHGYAVRDEVELAGRVRYTHGVRRLGR